MAHILVTGQTQHIYNQITHLLTASAGLSKLQPLSITTDFEMALMNNFRDHYPTVPINGCLFHAKQAWHKRLKKLRIDGNHFGYLIREHGLIDFLAVIPKNLVKVKGIPYIKTDLDRRFGSEINRYLWDQFWKYFVSTWVENNERFEAWHLLDSNGNIKDIINRTNNCLEGLHSRLNKKIPAHPSILDCIAYLKEHVEQEVQKLKAAQQRNRMPASCAKPVYIPLIPDDFESFDPNKNKT